MEALIIEKSEALRHIAQFLSPRISGAIYCSEAEKAEYEQERVRLSARIAEIEAIVSGQQRAEEQEQKINEIDAMDLPFDFDADFGTVGVNTIVRQMLKEERAGNFVAFNAEYDRLKAEFYEEVTGYAEREIQLQMQNKTLQDSAKNTNELILQLQATIESNDKLAEEKVNAENIRREEAEEMLFETNNHLKEVQQNRKNAADQLEEAHTEIERLNRLVDEQRIQFNFGEKGLQRTIEVSPELNNAYEEAKQATAEKRRVMITGNIGANFNTVTLPDGSTDVIHVSQMNEVDVVDSFHIELPSIENPAGEVEEGTGQDVEAENVVLGGIETTAESNQTEGEAPATTTAEEAQEAVREEAFTNDGKTIEQRVNQLESYMDSVLSKLGLYPDENAA